MDLGELPKPFPFYPTEVSIEEKKRNQLLTELNMWANNDEFIAKQKAIILIKVIIDQFRITENLFA